MLLLLLLGLALSRDACVTPAQCDTLRQAAARWKPAIGDAYNDADAVEPRLWLGNVCAAHNQSWLAAHNITLILCVAREWLAPCSAGGTSTQYWELDDSTGEDAAYTARLFDAAANALAQALHNQEAVLVHCNMGISRSTGVVLAYLMRHRGLSYDAALAHVRTVRATARPNRLFERLLRAPRQRPEL